MSSMKRGPNKPKALYPSGDFIALGSKTSRTLEIGDSKSAPKSPLSASGSGVERKRDGSSSGGPSTSLPSKKPKLSGATAFTPIGRVGTQLKKEVGKQGQWDSSAVEVPASELLTKVLEAEDSNDDERAESLLCGAVKQLKSTRTKPEPTLYLSLMYLAKTRPLMFCTDIVMEAFCSLLKRDVSVSYKTTKGNNMWAVLVVNILLAAYHDEESWPELFVKVFVEDSLGERVWVDLEDCKGFVDNILTAFKTKIPPKSMMAPELTFKPDACPSPPTISAEDDEASSSSFHLECQENLENIAVVPRFSNSEESVEHFVLDLIRDYLTRRQPTDVSRNMLRLLVSTCGLSEVRLLVAPKLEMWLQNPKLTRPAQDLLLAVCMNCSQHNQNDVEVIGHLIKIRMKTKPVINHFLQCIRELLNQHTENLSTLLKHAIYNELSNSRNPNNMQLISVIFQHSPERAAKVLADVFFDLLTNRDDYLRALRALFREIVRTLRHEVKFLAFCRGLMQERKDQSFLDMDPQIKERMFMSISDLLVLAILQGIGPAVKEASTALAREEKRDIGVLRAYQMQVAKIQRDAVWWLWIVPKMYKPDRNAFIHCLQKVLFMEPAEHYYNKDNWTPEGDRPMMLRLASEVPILEDTLMRILIIGLSKEHPLNASDTLDLVDQLLKRVGSISVEGYPVLELQIQEIFDLIFNLCAYHHPDNISLPPGYQPPSLAIADLYWRAWIILLILVAHNPSNFGSVAWNNYPTLRILMEMCITNHFTFPPPTMVSGEKAEEMCAGELQIAQLEKHEILEFESHLAAASTKVAITESNSLLLSKLLSMNPLGSSRKPPAAVLEQLKSLNQSLKLGHLLCRSRHPDFLLDIIHRQGTSHSMPWLAELVESCEGSFSMLPVQCLCEFLLNETPEIFTCSPEGTHEVRAKKKRKQEQLLVHLQTLLHDAGDDPQPTCEVLDYFMRRLSSQQASARKLAAKGLNLVLTQPNRSPGSDDDDLLEKETSEHSWLLKYMPMLPHFDLAKSQACFVLRQACHVENDPMAISAYVHFLSAYSPIDDQQNVGDLALDMAQLIVERPTIVNCILPSNGNNSSRKNSFLIAISKIFTTYLKQVRRPSKEAYAWSESQGHILVQWANGQAAIMHILVVHTMVILLTYGPPEGDRSHFEEMLEAWFPSDSEPPQAFLVDTSEEALLLPDWLKLRMIQSSVDILVDAALKDLDAGQLVLFVQSFGIPVLNMSKLLKALDIAVEFDSSAVDQAVVDKSYMAQLVQVQHQRGAVGGLNFSALLGETDCIEIDTEMEPTPAQTPVIQRAPPKPPAVLPIPLSLTQLFVESSPLTVGQELFKGLQKDLTVSIAKKQFDQGALYVFLCACEQLLEGKNNKSFVDGLLQKRLYSCVLFRIVTAALANTDMSINPVTSKCVWICRQIITLAGSCVSPLLSILRQFLKQHGEVEVSVQKGKCWKNLSQIKLTSDIVMKVILKVEQEQPSYLEEAVCDLIREGVKQGKSKELVVALTEVLIKKVMDSSILSSSATHQISLYIDWLHHLEPELIGSCPELQQQLLFMKHHKKENGRLPSDSSVLFQPCLWALLIHQASWETINGCIKSLLDKNTVHTSYNPTAVLTFLWACIHIPKIWQGRDKKIPKHYQEEDILALTKDQLTTVVDYILEESVNMCKTTVTPASTDENSTHKKTEVNPVVSLRVPLLLRCCSSSCKIKFVVDHLLDVINNRSDSLYKDSGHQLLVQLYLQVPSLVFKVSELSSVLKDSQNTTSGSSKMDIFSHTLLTSLSFMGSNDLSKDRFLDLELVCRKMASSHPLLVLRQLPLISVLLCGRVNLEFSTFLSQRHMNLFTCMLGLLELLVPHLFRPEYAMALPDTLDTYMEIFEIHGTQRDLVSLMNRYLQLLQQYLSASPSSARAFLHRRQSTLMYLSAQYPDLSSLKSLMTGISVTSTDLASSIHETDRESDRGEVKGQTTTTSSRFLRTSSAWTQAQLAPLATRLSQTNHPEDVAAALHELKAVAEKRPAILEHFVDDLKQLMQSPFDTCHSTAFHLVLHHLKTKPGCCKQYLSAFLQCLESKHPNVVLTAVECLPQFVVLAQEYATIVLQKAFLVGITSNLNTAPQISKSIKLLHLQTGS